MRARVRVRMSVRMMARVEVKARMTATLLTSKSTSVCIPALVHPLHDVLHWHAVLGAHQMHGGQAPVHPAHSTANAWRVGVWRWV